MSSNNHSTHLTSNPYISITLILNSCETRGLDIPIFTGRDGTAPYAAPPVPVQPVLLSEDVLQQLEDDVQNEQDQFFTHLCLLLV